MTKQTKVCRPGFREALKASGKKAREVAEMIGVTPGHLSSYGSGRFGLDADVLSKLAKVLGADPQNIDKIGADVLREEEPPYRTGMQTSGMKGAAAIIEDQLAVWAASLPDLPEQDRVIALHRIIAEAYELLRRADPAVLAAVDAIMKDSLGDVKKPIGFGPRSIFHHCYMAGKKGLPEPFFAADNGFQKPVKPQVSP